MAIRSISFYYHRVSQCTINIVPILEAFQVYCSWRKVWRVDSLQLCKCNKDRESNSCNSTSSCNIFELARRHYETNKNAGYSIFPHNLYLNIDLNNTLFYTTL